MYTKRMIKEAKWLAIIFAFLVVVSAGAGLYALANGDKDGDKSPEAQQRAISEALQKRNNPSDTSCATVLTDAVHPETGAKYTFSDSCLPPGWERAVD